MLELSKIPKTITLPEFINKCNIPGIGPETSRKIASRVQNIQTLRNLIEEETIHEALKGIVGDKVIESLSETLSDIEWILLLEDMEDEGYDLFSTDFTEVYEAEDLDSLITAIPQNSIKDLPIDLKGQNICITGTLSLPRKMFQSMIEKNGGKFQSSVTNSTDILIYSNSDGMNTVKYKRAEEMRKKGAKISMVTEKVFVDKL